MKSKTCIICNREFTGQGNNGYPITNMGVDKVCSYCDRYVVLPARMSDDIMIPEILSRNNITIKKENLRDDLRSLKPGDHLYEEFSEILGEIKLIKTNKVKKEPKSKAIKKKTTKKKETKKKRRIK
jgi:hypothetical protein